MSTSGLGAPGAASYSSNTLHVGDGTWDSSRDDFLLPNLVGLNFETMRYNGMGNRFAGLPQYHTLILGHGILAAITFIGLLPAAIFIAGFYSANKRAAFKMHVYLQILIVFSSTIVIVLGWFAVGPERSLTNPHHGIGIAIYVCILVQFLYGWLMARLERRRKISHPTIPLKVWLHKLFGRAIALLAFVQIALGLTLYGAPKSLFVLYALAGALLLFIYLTLTYRNMPVDVGVVGRRPSRRSDTYTDYNDSYVSGQQTDVSHDPRRRPEKSHWVRNAAAAAGLVGAYEWFKHRGSKRQRPNDSYYDDQSSYTQRPSTRPGNRPPSQYGDRPPTSAGGPPGHIPPGQYAPTPYARPPPPSGQGFNGPQGSYLPAAGGYIDGRPPTRSGRHDQGPPSSRLSDEDTWERDDEDEKFDSRPRPQLHTWRDRILGAAGGIAAYEGVKSIFSRRKPRRDGTIGHNAGYRRPSEGHTDMVSQTDVSRVEAGEAPFSPHDGRRPHQGHMPDVTPITPTRPPNRRRPSIDDGSYDDDESLAAGTPRPGTGEPHTLRDSIATFGAIAGFREWNRRRRERKEQQRNDAIRRQELANGEFENRPEPQDGPYGTPAHPVRPVHQGPSVSTVMTGVDQPGHASTIHSSRQNLRPDTNLPPLPAAAGILPAVAAVPPAMSSYNSRHNMAESIRHQHAAAQSQTFSIPPPPPGSPPNAARPMNYEAPAPGSLQMPVGAVEPDPSRLVSEHSAHHSSSRLHEAADLAGGAAAGAVAAELIGSGGHHSQSGSPSRRGNLRADLRDRRNSSTSQLIEADSGGVGSVPSPVSLSVRMHQDGRQVTIRRLNEEEAAAKKAARRQERRFRRNSNMSSEADDLPVGGAGPGPASSRFRRNQGGVVPSSSQPITNVPPPPAMSSSALGSHRPPSELNLPSPPPHMSVPIQQSVSPPARPGEGLSSPAGGAGGYTTDIGTGTDVSAFDTNRRRRRAERARQRAAAEGSGNRVAFEE